MIASLILGDKKKKMINMFVHFLCLCPRTRHHAEF